MIDSEKKTTAVCHESYESSDFRLRERGKGGIVVPYSIDLLCLSTRGTSNDQNLSITKRGGAEFALMHGDLITIGFDQSLKRHKATHQRGDHGNGAGRVNIVMSFIDCNHGTRAVAECWREARRLVVGISIANDWSTFGAGLVTAGFRLTHASPSYPEPKNDSGRFFWKIGNCAHTYLTEKYGLKRFGNNDSGANTWKIKCLSTKRPVETKLP